MRSGDFTATARIRANDEIGRLLRRIDAAIDHLNVRYEHLAGELQDKLRNADAAAPRGAQAGARRARVDRAALRSSAPRPTAADGDEMNLNRIRAPLFAFILAEELTRSYLPDLREPAAGDDARASRRRW